MIGPCLTCQAWREIPAAAAGEAPPVMTRAEVIAAIEAAAKAGKPIEPGSFDGVRIVEATPEAPSEAQALRVGYCRRRAPAVAGHPVTTEVTECWEHIPPEGA